MLSNEKCIGIYCIENLINGKKYIGQSKNIYRRWKEHENDLINNIHFNKHLQRSWNKYGKDSFTFYILQRCSEKQLDELEQYWISYYDSYKHGYNRTIGGSGTIGIKVTDETKAKISKTLTGRKWTVKKREQMAMYYKNNNYTPPWSKKVVCVTTGEIFDTITKASNKYGIMNSNISLCCEHQREFAGEMSNGMRLQWEWYEEEKEYIKKKQILRSNKERPILQYDLDHNFIREWSSAKECHDKTGIQRSRISDVCKGNRRQTGGYIFTYKEAI